MSILMHSHVPYYWWAVSIHQAKYWVRPKEMKCVFDELGFTQQVHKGCLRNITLDRIAFYQRTSVPWFNISLQVSNIISFYCRLLNFILLSTLEIAGCAKFAGLAEFVCWILNFFLVNMAGCKFIDKIQHQIFAGQNVRQATSHFDAVW